MAAYVLGQASAHPDKLALRVLMQDGAEDWSYGALEQAVRGTAAGLLACGAVPGDRILMRLGNTVDFPLAYLGALAAGMIPVPTSAALTEAEVAWIIGQLRPRLILRDTQVPCPAAPDIIARDTLMDWRSLPCADYHIGDPERPGYIIYTSGTSGTPRAVVHAHRAIWARQMMFQGWYGVQAQDRMLHAGAFNWTYTLGTGLMDPWTVGATAIIPAPGTASAALPALIRDHGATIFAAAPGVYRQMLQATDQMDMPLLRHGLSAGEKLPARISDMWTQATGLKIYEAYGMSECSTFLSACPQAPADAGTLGRPQPGRRVAILGPDGPVPRGTEGTIAVHRSDPGLMLGYLDAADETAARMQGDWFVTGDQGVMGDDDQITYLGRNDDMMNAGGYRVSPLEVEQVLMTAPGITGAGCVAVEIKQDAFVIAAFCTSDHPIDEAALKAHAARNLAAYKQPRLYILTDQLPTGANNKILRRALREQFAAMSRP